MDHFFQIEMVGKANEPMLEGYSTLSFLAAVTKRVRLGTLVTGVIYRYPGILIKTVTTLDVLSGGRAYFGIGAAWNQREAIGLGIPFPPAWGTLRAFGGDTADCQTHVVREDHPLQWQILQTRRAALRSVAAFPTSSADSGRRHQQKKTFDLVAQYADACNLYAFDGADAVRAKLAVLRRHCDEIGRPFEEIERTAIGMVDIGPGKMSPQEVIDHFHSMSEAGIQHLILSLAGVHEITPIDKMGQEVIPAVSRF